MVYRADDILVEAYDGPWNTVREGCRVKVSLLQCGPHAVLGNSRHLVAHKEEWKAERSERSAIGLQQTRHQVTAWDETALTGWLRSKRRAKSSQRISRRLELLDFRIYHLHDIAEALPHPASASKRVRSG